MKRFCSVLPVLLALSLVQPAAAEQDVQASPPKGVSLAVYDTGLALANELRTVTLAQGENRIWFRGVPAQLDPASVSFSTPGAPSGLDVLEQQFLYDLPDAGRLLSRYAGRPVEVVVGGVRERGILVSGAGSAGLSLRADDGSVRLFPDLHTVGQVVFPQAEQIAYLEPALVWRVKAAEEGPRNLRLAYTVSGLRWSASYEAVLGDSPGEASLAARVTLDNRTGGRFENARVKVVATEKGGAAPVAGAAEGPSGPALRYPYGSEQATFERQAASGGALTTYELPRTATLDPDELKTVELLRVEKLPVSRFYVYDGVKFDRFPRNRRNDWNFGTEFHRTVEEHFSFDNTAKAGLGADLPPGVFRLYQRREDGSVDLMGEDLLPATSAEKSAHVLVGPARGLIGERERTGYSEITPLHEYEETFEIRLENASTAEVEIRVVEHLYRWEQFQVVKADTDYTATGAQTIEFRPTLKPGGKRSVHYTVRYRW